MATALLGLLGLSSVLLADRQRWLRKASWLVSGALLATAVVTWTSIGPLVFLAALAFGGAALIGAARCDQPKIVGLGAAAAASAIAFILLFPFAKHRGVEAVTVPIGSIVTGIFPARDLR